MRIVLVTGSARRLGKCFIKRFAEAGDKVWVHYRSSEKEAKALVTELTSEGYSARCLYADVSIREDVSKMMSIIKEEDGHLDVLINNVGLYICGDILTYSIAHFEQTIQSNLLGAYYCIHDALQIMNDGGSIINIGYSGLNAQAAHTYNTAYVVSKLGLSSLTKSYASALGDRQIRCNMISPGQLNNSVDLPKNIESLVPLGRAGTPDDIANLAVFLCSNEASYITGQNIDVAGGYMLKLQDHL
jgi:3-oxoacyl-[acyl-carrier protein] reductase